MFSIVIIESSQSIPRVKEEKAEKEVYWKTI